MNKSFYKVRIKAFTMADMLGGMVISSIIIGMIFFLLIGVNKQFYEYRKMKSQVLNFLLFKSKIEIETDAL